VKRSRLNPVNAKRRAKEFARTYGGKARVAWVKQLGCCICKVKPADNAHLPSRSGMGRKGDADRIVPLCRLHHQELHEQGQALVEARHGIDLSVWADAITIAWERKQNESGQGE